MPLYEYECDACGQRFEVIRKFSDPPIDVCRKCGKGPVRRLQSSPAIQFKGSGWYITDYAKKSAGESEKSTTAPSGEAKSSDSPAKSDTASKADAPATPSPSPSTAKE
jgi:putative FmdB family regulatory protein